MLRDKRIDIARGIGIILVCYGHTFGYCPIYEAIYLFHMPLFFVLSGCFTCPISNVFDFKRIIHKKLRTIIVPYLFFLIIPFIIKLFTRYIKNRNLYVSIKEIGSIKAINFPLWFFLCLFIGVIIYSFIINIKNYYFQAIITFSLSIMAFIVINTYTINQWLVPLFQAILVLPFFYIGYLYYHFNSKKRRIFYYFSLLYLVGIIMKVHTDVGGLHVNHNYLLFFLPALGGSMLVLLFSQLVVKIKILSTHIAKLGSMSVYIFGIHGNLLSFSNAISEKIGFNNVILKGIMEAIIMIYVSYVIGIFLNRYLPFIFHYKNNK